MFRQALRNVVMGLWWPVFGLTYALYLLASVLNGMVILFCPSLRAQELAAAQRPDFFANDPEES